MGFSIRGDGDEVRRMATDLANHGLNIDLLLATADLVGRTGAVDFQIGFDGPDDERARWWAEAHYTGKKLRIAGRHTPSEALLTLSERLLTGGTCRCRREVSMGGDSDDKHCSWHLMGPRWEPGCDAAPIHITGPRGDLDAIRRQLESRSDDPA